MAISLTTQAQNTLLNAMSQSAGMASSPAYPADDSQKSHFLEFCAQELKYHKTMVDMYEFLMAQDSLRGANDATGDMLRNILIAGMQALAGK